MLEIKKVNLAYGQMQVLKEVSLQVRDREIVSLIGANSAGKSSMLNAISGLVPLAGGEILFDGNPIHSLPSHEIIELGIIQVPEGRRIFPYLSVRENLLMGCYSRRARPKSGETLQRVLELFPQLAERSSQLGESMSGGEQQMLAIGRGLMAGPKILMLDEPSLGLAPRVVQQIFDTIRKLREQGLTILLVEQNARKGLQNADQGVVLDLGTNSFERPADEVLHDPRIQELYLGKRRQPLQMEKKQ